MQHVALSAVYYIDATGGACCSAQLESNHECPFELCPTGTFLAKSRASISRAKRLVGGNNSAHVTIHLNSRRPCVRKKASPNNGERFAK